MAPYFFLKFSYVNSKEIRGNSLIESSLNLVVTYLNIYDAHIF